MTPAIVHDRGIPTDLFAERTALGAMMQNLSALQEGLVGLRDADLAVDGHRRILGAMRRLANDGHAVDEITVCDLLRRRRELEGVGGAGYVESLQDGLIRNSSVGDYLRILREKSQARIGMELCDNAIYRLADGFEDARDVLAALSDRVTEEIGGPDAGRPVSAAEHTARELERFHARAYAGESMGFSYGNADLDQLTHGMQPGEVTVVGARSGVGKTAMMMQTVAANCRQGVGVDVFSLEAPAGRLFLHLWAMESGVPYARLRRPYQCTPDDLRAVDKAAAQVAEWNLHIHDRSGQGVQQIAARARLSKRQHGKKLVCVDYAQIVDADARDDRQRVAMVSQTLTRLAKDEALALMLLSQLARVPREFYGKPPSVNDLRETGQLENDAHQILLLHRAWDVDTGKMAEMGEVLVPKIRDGEPGVVKVRFCKRSLRFL